ncbi:hypothetical protein M011DRAFT_480325 [Sporormia fimetaria CBS 119925]|uniref:Uncharacterized protein n=1 Tax=Sporormia fimetaria CBS 119925 TaxID=1340428 RepID=A0A6A6V286_9PLEO|nr:hypothetical protein M011DRAFT_480325 [Sporormia fimetaria CBS 119925]
MAPLDPNVTGRSNVLPLSLFGAQVLGVAGLTTHILHRIYRAAQSLPPSASTRTQRSTRLRNAGIFATLAALSIASVTTFAVAWRALSYFEWAEKGAHESPGTIWTGWYGTGDEGVGRWRLGDWWKDVDLLADEQAKALASPEAFLYLYQHFFGVTAAAIFFGVEGRRRNIAISTIAAFVALSIWGSLGLALNLFFVLLIFTPMAVHDDESVRHDALFAPKPWVLYVPVIAAVLLEQSLPALLAHRKPLAPYNIGYLAITLFLAFAPEIIPTRFGHRHTSKRAAHHAYTKPFYILSVTSILLTWKQFVATLLINTPPPPSYYDLMKNYVTNTNSTNRLMTGISTTGQKLKIVSGHPAISVTGTDVLFTAISLLVWCFVRQLDVHDVLDNSILRFFDSKRGERHVAFKEEVEELADAKEEEQEVEPPAVTPRKRGRPRKHPLPGTTQASPRATKVLDPTPAEASGASASPTPRSALRRSTRRSRKSATDLITDESEVEDETYQPPEDVAKEVQQMEMDAVSGPMELEDLVEGGEGTAVGLVNLLVGGLGALAAGVLGAEVTGGV